MLKCVALSVLLVGHACGAAVQYPQESRLLYTETIAASVIKGAPPGARLIRTRGDLPPLIERLISNATDIKENIVDTFRCEGRVYGYYADLDNMCQIFHICVPMQQLFPDLYDSQDVYQFSFICPQHTIFTQDAMVCAWEDSAFPCLMAHQLYDRNNLFFVVPAEEVQRSPTTSTPPSTVTSPSSVLLAQTTALQPNTLPTETTTATTIDTSTLT